MGLDADLTAYYDAEARAGVRGELDTMRVDIRNRFIDVMRREGRCRLVDVGSGPGRDTLAFQHDGFDTIGVDLAPANTMVMRERGAVGAAGSLYALPLADATFDVLWTMSTFVHVPHDRFDEAMNELVRVVTPGAPLTIGTWGGRDFEGVPEFGPLLPYRFSHSHRTTVGARCSNVTGNSITSRRSRRHRRAGGDQYAILRTAV